MTTTTILAPTPEQQAIIDAATTDASLMVNALAGTGKTTTLTMLAKALPKRSSLALAFNVKIKKELEKRFPDHFTVMTMNGLGHRAWSFAINKKQLTLDNRKLIKIVSEVVKPHKELQKEFNDIRQLVVYAMQRGLVPSAFQNFKGLLPDTPESWQSVADAYMLDLSGDAILAARKALIENIDQGLKGVISFDDQLYLSALCGGAFPRFDIVLVDEAQDLSPLNHIMLRKCAAGRLIVVGDPRQAIYAFRGADSSSMGSIRALRQKWIELPLNTTFRCPRKIVERQWEHAPDYRAAPTNPDGRVITLGDKKWDWSTIQQAAKTDDIAVLCRNNAPLLTLAFKLIRSGISVQMLGRDIGKSLTSVIRKIAPAELPIADFIPLLEEWKDHEISLAEANGSEAKATGIVDRYECICAVIEGANPKTTADLSTCIEDLFAAEHGRVVLASGHRSKGLEWKAVVHLDPWRIPSKHALRTLDRGDPRPIEQENNLRYVIETRTMQTLIMANMDHWKGAGA